MLSLTSCFFLIQGQWGVTAEQEAEEKKRVQDFQETVPKMRAQLRILTHFYQVWGAASGRRRQATKQMVVQENFLTFVLPLSLSEHRAAVPGPADDQLRRESTFPQLQTGLQRTLQVCFTNVSSVTTKAPYVSL